MAVPGVDLATILVETAARLPERPAVQLGEAVLGYRELDEASAQAADHRSRTTRPQSGYGGSDFGRLS